MRFIILIAVVVVVAAAGLLTLKFASDTTRENVPAVATVPGAQGGVETVDVLVARNDISLGTVLNESMIDRQPWPKHLVVNGFVVAGTPEANVAGMVARSDIKAREPLFTARLAKPNDASFLAAGLDENQRAVTVPVDAISGVAGYIFPGDRVDVMFTHRVPQDAPAQLGEAQPPMGATSAAGRVVTTSEVLLANVRVLAVNTRQVKPPEGQQPPPNANEAPSNITLALTQDEAKRIRLSEKNGTLSLALRSVKDEGDGGVGTPVTVEDVSRVDSKTQYSKWNNGKRGMYDARWDASGLGQDEVIIIRGVQVEKPASKMPAGQTGMIGFVPTNPLPSDNY